MVSLDQVKLLEAKIGSAVDKISQLQVENDALRKRVQELSNALSAKSEQLSVCEQNFSGQLSQLENKILLCEQQIAERERELAVRDKDQELIETGILKALNRLNSIENSVLAAGADANAAVTGFEAKQETAQPVVTPVNPSPVSEPENIPFNTSSETIPSNQDISIENPDNLIERSIETSAETSIESPIENSEVYSDIQDTVEPESETSESDLEIKNELGSDFETEIVPEENTDSVGFSDADFGFADTSDNTIDDSLDSSIEDSIEEESLPEIDIPVENSEPVENPFDLSKSDVPGFDIF